VEKRIFDGRVEEDEGLLIRFKAWDWVFGEKRAKGRCKSYKIIIRSGREGILDLSNSIPSNERREYLSELYELLCSVYTLPTLLA
jgi:hypothetical protein